MEGTRRAMVSAALALVTASMAFGLAAQTDEEMEKTLPFLGAWDSDVSVPTVRIGATAVGSWEITARIS